MEVDLREHIVSSQYQAFRCVQTSLQMSTIASFLPALIIFSTRFLSPAHLPTPSSSLPYLPIDLTGRFCPNNPSKGGTFRMAKVQLSVLMNDIRGKAGTVVFTESREGLVTKPRVTPQNPRTPKQVAVRQAFGRAAAAFRNMTNMQAQLWQRYAQTQNERQPITGRHFTLTAINAFMRLAIRFQLVNPTGTIPMTPPATEFTGDNIIITASPKTGAVSFTASGANSANVKTELLLQPLASPHRKPSKNGYRSQSFVAFATGSLNVDVSVPPGWYAPAYTFVNTQTGQEVGVVTLPIVQVALATAKGGSTTTEKKAA
jgi:hypothetical protein